MIALGPEPQGFLLRKADVLGWLQGLKEDQWRKLRPTLTEVHLPGMKKPYYRKAEIRERIISPNLK